MIDKQIKTEEYRESFFNGFELKGKMIDFSAFQPYPKCTDREKWDNIREDYKRYSIAKAEEALDSEFEALSADLYLYTGRSDDLTRYDRLKGRNWGKIASLTLAECIEDKGRFTEKIFNGIWNELDAATWHRPCPTPMYKRFPAVMVDVTDPLIELGSSSIAFNLAVTYYLLQDKLDAMYPHLYKRLYTVLDERIFKPYLEREDYWWMAYERHLHRKMGVLYSINNFTTHCTHHVLEALLLIEKNTKKREAAVEKTLDVLNNYLAFVKDDGWCDEGTGYWHMAYGCLNLVLENIYKATGGYVDVFKDEKIHAMGQFMCNAYIGNGYFVNFADCHPIQKRLSFKIIKYAINTNNKGMLKMVFDIIKNDDSDSGIINLMSGYEQTLFMLLNLDKVILRFGVDPSVIDYLEHEHFYEDSQVLTARENKDSYDGLYLACKGGHNDENHNHNDAGNFIVYKDSTPVLVDPGIEAYIADTFNTNRYKLWTMQSKYHNLPTFNGVIQKETRKYRAKDVSFLKKADEPGMVMNLKDAYEPSSGLIKFKRRIILDRERSIVECSDDFILREASGDIEFSFMTPCDMKFYDGKIEFYNDGKCLASMEYDNRVLEPDEEEIQFRCERLKEEWGGQLKRLVLRVSEPVRELKTTFRIG